MEKREPARDRIARQSYGDGIALKDIFTFRRRGSEAHRRVWFPRDAVSQGASAGQSRFSRLSGKTRCSIAMGGVCIGLAESPRPRLNQFEAQSLYRPASQIEQSPKHKTQPPPHPAREPCPDSVVCIIAMIRLPEHTLETLPVEVEDGQMERCTRRPCLVRFVMFSMCSAVSERPVPNRKPLPKRPSSSQSRSSLRQDVVLARDRHEKCPRFHEGIIHPLACELGCFGDRRFSGPACGEPRQPDRAIRYPAAGASWAPA
jgi:hypothetical protein